MVCDKVCVKLLYVKVGCVTGGRRREEEATRDTESKTRTPHKVVGNPTQSCGEQEPHTKMWGTNIHTYRNISFRVRAISLSFLFTFLSCVFILLSVSFQLLPCSFHFRQSYISFDVHLIEISLLSFCSFMSV